MSWKRWAVGLGSALLIAETGRRTSALTDDGAAAAVAVGTAIVAGTSWPGASLLGFFFASGSALSRVFDQPDPVGKSGGRDAFQVLANGGVAALAALTLNGRAGDVRFTALAGSLSAASADTWATEIGSSSPTSPRLIISGERVEPGLSGGVTARGTLAAIGGALTVGALTAIYSSPQQRLPKGAAVVMAGFGGCLLDSVLGELAQERRWSVVAKRRIERAIDCGQPTLLVGGIRGVTNDLVNLAATSFGALVAVGLERLITSAVARRVDNPASR